MAIKVLSLAENGYRRLANAITVTILMHTTFSPFDRISISQRTHVYNISAVLLICWVTMFGILFMFV